MEPIIQYFIDNPGFTLIGALTLIQIAPIKLDPWSKVISFVRSELVGKLEKNMAELRRDVDEEKADRLRWDILDFGNSCRNGRRHSREEWKHCIDQLEKYESFCEKRKIENGVIKEDGKYIRSLYQERNSKNDWL